MLTLYIADVERDAGMKKLSREEAAKVLEGMKVKTKIPKAAVTQWERNAALDMAIEVLNCSEIPNSSDDTISRRAAIDALDEQIEQCNKALGSFDISSKDKYAIKVERASLKAYKEQLENMPSVQPEQVCVANVTLTDEQVKEVVEKAKNAVISVIELEPHWIPCSERLPEIGEYVLCYLKGRRYFGQYRVCKYCAADKYVNHPYFDFNENGFPNIVAWMPLPEPPYKEEQDGNK